MKTSEIFNLTLKEFENELSPLNHEYVIQVYKSSLRAFIRYQEMADFVGKDEFLNINEFFNLNRETSTEYQEYLKELFPK
ncbi:hypothetical protein NNC19_11630 [Clostridium sp. SHJSY1]|uniref:hypothetical protein n=1 Tax=Clostridium sp. SHJSY1 TaxID=2942483 RepID=UPI0028770BAD|nr:hypothetical protein [Clostridium sp. SHJSY1]MDS0526332.1 hypothetical protein [Clostridium sp. SHJSY1]